MAVDGLAASTFALLGERGSLRFVTDVVHEDDALCLALACRALRDALWARFPARPAGHAHAGKRLWTRDAMVARLGSAVTTAGELVLTNHEFFNPETGNYDCGRPLSLPEGVGRLAYLPHPGLRRLHLHNITELATLPEAFGRLGSLEELIIEDCAGLLMERAINKECGLQALLAYMRGETIEGLEVLDLLGCGKVRLRAPPEGIGRLPSLTTLNMGSHSIGAEGAAALAERPGLTTLYVKGNTIGVQGAVALATLPRLATLDVEDNSIGAQGAAALSKLSSLTTLNVGNNAIGAEGAAALTKLPSLATLNVNGNAIGVKGARALAERPSLTTLDVGYNAIGDEGAAALAELPSLTTLNAMRNSIGAKGAAALAELPSLTTLDVGNNAIGATGAAALAKLPSLTALTVNGNAIGVKGARALAERPSLTTLDVGYNAIGDEGAAALAELPSLTTLDVVSNAIGVQGAAALANLPRLATLNIRKKHYGAALRRDDNDIKKHGAMALATRPNLITMDGYTRTKEGNFEHLKCTCWKGPPRRGLAAFRTCTFH